MEGLSRLIGKDKREGIIDGIKFNSFHYITHLLFMDGVLLFGSGLDEDWISFQGIIRLFCDASGMEVRAQKSVFLHNNISNEFFSNIACLFPFNIEHIDVEFKYLGYFIKPNNCKKEDWVWLLKKVGKK